MRFARRRRVVGNAGAGLRDVLQRRDRRRRAAGAGRETAGGVLRGARPDRHGGDGDVIDYAHERGLLVILDGKRNDIGTTAAAYARGYLGRDESAWHADALTVSPYLGDDSLTPFVDVAAERGAGMFVLVKTSNPGGGMLQDLVADGQQIYRHVAEHVERLATETAGECGYGSVGAVVGATYPEQLAELRAAMPHTWFLVPGFGSQGGTAADVAAAFDDHGLGAIVNNSRGIIFAHAPRVCRAVRRRALAGGGRGRHARDDRRACALSLRACGCDGPTIDVSPYSLEGVT